MIISGNSSGSLPFLRQIIPPYLSGDLNFGFNLQINGLGPSVEFGLAQANNTPIVSYNLSSGLVFDYSGRLAGTYQSGNNTFEYHYNSGKQWQSINDRLVSVDDFTNYTGTPFERFYIKNKNASPVDFDLNIFGFSPPTIYSPLSLAGSGILSGELIQSGFDANPSQGILYQVFGISIPSGYGVVNYFQPSGIGGIKYSISGTSFSAGDIIPVSFNTYWGQFIQSLEVGGSIAGETGSPETGIYLSLYGAENFIYANQTLDFAVDYFSNSAFPVTIELSGSGQSSLALLSGSGEGYVTYQGNVFGSGTIFSTGPATGIADLFAPENLTYNTQYTPIDQYLNISSPATQFVSKYTNFIGDYTVTYSGVEVEGTYEGPSPAFLGKIWRATGDVDVTYSFVDSDNGVLYSAASWPASGNPNYNSGAFKIKYGTNFVEYPYNPATYPTGIGSAYVEDTVTGRGIVTITEPVSFFGFGTGTVLSGTTYIPATGTGNGIFTGDIRDWLYYYEYQLNYPDYPVYPDIDADPNTIISGGAIVRVKNQYYYGTTQYLGVKSVITGVPDVDEYTWGYPTGPSYINSPEGTPYAVVKVLDIPQILFYPPSGDPLTGSFSGEATGYVQAPAFRIPGPTFPDPKDTGFYTFGGGNGLTAINAVYGRGGIFGQMTISYASLGEQGSPPVTFEIFSGSYVGEYTENLTDATQGLFLPNPLFPIRYQEDAYGLYFTNNDLSVAGTGLVFTGYAKVSTAGIANIFNLYEAYDEDSPYNDYKASGWINGNRLVRPVPEVFGAGADSRALRVAYLSTDEESRDVATLRVSGGGIVAEVLITGGGFERI